MTVLELLRSERSRGYKGGLYHATQIIFAFNSNHIEGSRLTEEQTRLIYETKSFFPSSDSPVYADDVIETVNHFRLMDYMLEHAEDPLTEDMIKEFHRILKSGTIDALEPWFRVGEYKEVANSVGGINTATPKQTPIRMTALVNRYGKIQHHTLEDIVDFHFRFEQIHPFQDGNGRVGRIVMFKECLKNDVMPFVILDRDKVFYYRGLREYEHQPGYLLGTCQMSQDFYSELYHKLAPSYGIEGYIDSHKNRQPDKEEDFEIDL